MTLCFTSLLHSTRTWFSIFVTVLSSDSRARFRIKVLNKQRILFSIYGFLLTLFSSDIMTRFSILYVLLNLLSSNSSTRGDRTQRDVAATRS